MSSLQETALDFETRHTDNKWLLRCIMFSAILFMISPIAGYQKTNKNVGAIGFGSAIVLSFIQLLAAEKSRKTEKLFNAYSEGVLKATADTIASQINVSALTNQIGLKEALVNIIESMPDYKQDRYIAELQLQGLTTPTTNQLLNSSASQNIVTIDLPQREIQPVQSIEDQIDIEWMKTHSFFFASTAILGEEGSGKTDLLAFMVMNILRIAPDTDLKIYDIHYDPDEKRKFPNMSREREESLFISDPKECYRDIMRTRAILAKRELDKDKKGCPVVRVTDELIGLKDYIDKNEWEEFINAIMQIKQRGRKWSRIHENGQDLGMRMIVGLHSAKKGETGLPSGFFSGANFLALGESIFDAATMFPANFDISELVKSMKAVTSLMIEEGLINPKDPSKDLARPAVVKLKGGVPEVLMIPKFDLSKYHFTESEPIKKGADDRINGEPISPDRHPGNDWLEKISSWILSLDSEPTDSQLNVAFFQITSKELDTETRIKLRQLISKKFE